MHRQWRCNQVCPVPCTLAIEIVSPGQTLTEFEDLAGDYLKAGCNRVWVVDPEQRKLTAFYPDGNRQDYTDDVCIEDKMLPGLNLTVDLIWSEAGI